MGKLLKDMTEPELGALTQTCGLALELAFESCGIAGRPRFVLLLFNDPKVTQYCSSCNRSDAIAALREAADRLEKKEDLPRKPWGPRR